jgi:hypothetical protein
MITAMEYFRRNTRDGSMPEMVSKAFACCWECTVWYKTRYGSVATLETERLVFVCSTLCAIAAESKSRSTPV